MSAYTIEEELRLGCPIKLEPDALPCDRAGCDATARHLVPGCALCDACAAEFGLGVGERYAVPVSELVGDERWRAARRAEYADRIRAMPPLEREARRDALLGQLAAEEVEAFLADAVAP